MSYRYRPKEVRYALRRYHELRAVRGTAPGRGLESLILVADIDRAYAACQRAHGMEVAFLVGFHREGRTFESMATALGKPVSTLFDRFTDYVDWMTEYLNGGVDG